MAAQHHQHLHWFEHHHGLLKLVCHYFVEVSGPEIHSRNAMPWSRLFLVDPDGPRDDSRVRDLAASGQEQVFALAPGGVLFMPPGRLLGFDFSAGLRMLAFHFRLEVTPGHDLFAGRATCALRTDRAPLVQAAYDAVRGPHHLGAVTMLRGLLLMLAADFIDGDLGDLGRQQAVRHRFAPVLLHIDAQCRIDLKITDLAALAELGREHFARQFRRDFGVGPKEYLAQRVLERACARLLAGERVQDVAGALGFASPFYFSRFFKAATGLSPREFGLRQLTDEG
jgi:AraC-like DNA-binding protein